MQPTLEKSNYPVFEANQVLSNRHLNQVRDYLDEQERLTRANLIGIGIACGLEVSLGGTAAEPVVQIAKGCGVTSQGYLIVEPRALKLVAYKEYKAPPEVEYPLLTANRDYSIYEMFEAGEPEAKLFKADPGFLNDKVVVLFLELKKDNLRNCSPTNCDDRGAEVTIAVRRLLVSKSNQQEVLLLLDGTLNTKKKITLDDYEKELLLELKLPDLRLPRYNVPAGPLISSNVVLSGFFTAIRNANLANQLGTALSAAYHAFQPVVRDFYPNDPFLQFNNSNYYGFLNSAPTNVAQVRFLQYYYDLFDDLIKAYDEFRWKGAELMCACCPSEELFPRHLVLSLAHPELDTGAAIYRHYFRASSAISGCEKHTGELQQLFRRLVEMTERFTNEPPLVSFPPPSLPTVKDRRLPIEPAPPLIRITPSKLGNVALSEKAIPYYYTQDGSPRLFQLWNAEKTRRQKANQNLSYRAKEYNAPAFAQNPLLYDLEPYNFLRIEGHIGLPWQETLQKLLDLRNQNRLPIDIIALRTGAFDESMAVDISKAKCRFEDLEVLYDATREQWLGQLCNDLTALYNVDLVPIPVIKPEDQTTEQQEIPNNNRAAATADTAANIATEFASKYAFINTYAAGFKVQSAKIGGHYENAISVKDISGINDNFFELFTAIFNLVNVLPQSLQEFQYKAFKARLSAMLQAAYRVELGKESLAKTGKIAGVFDWEASDDRLESLRLGFRSEVFKTLNDEYIRRYKEVQQKQFLSNFLLKNPGIQHKAGVPMGGTFILVYHDDPPTTRFGPNPKDVIREDFYNDVSLPIAAELLEQDKNYAARTGEPITFTKEFERAFIALQANPKFALDADFHTLVTAWSHQIFDIHANFDFLLNDDANKIIAQYVNGLPDGIIIADFFLPYLCCSDCAGVQYVLGQAPLTFTFTIGCTGTNDKADVLIMPQGGASPYSYKVDNQAYRQLSGALALGVGSHTLTLRDSQSTESTAQTFEIKAKIALGTATYTCGIDGKFYKALFPISGGTGPYTPNRGSIAADNAYTSDEIPSGTRADIIISDSKGCQATLKAEHTCPAPLDFTVKAGCTEEGNQAFATITVTGGEPEYQIKVGEKGNFGALTTPYKLPAGEYTVTIRDSKNVETSKSVKIPARLQAVVLPDDYKCLAGSTNYQATVTVSGGTLPYRIDDKTIKDNKFVTKPLASGSKLTLTITDEVGCSTTVLIQHSCIKKIPTFEVSVGPTRKNQAELIITPQGTIEPYQLSLNGKEFHLWKNPITVAPGEYTINIKDAADTIAEPKKIVVPPSLPPVLLAAPEYRCEAGKYVATFQVTGGNPPYQLVKGGGTISPNGMVESVPTTSGTTSVLTIIDGDGNELQVVIQQDCPAPCGLPCLGLSQLCAYRLWMQPATFRSYEAKAVDFKFTNEKGDTQDIQGLDVGMPFDLLNKDFHGAMRAHIGQINANLAKRLKQEGLLTFYYEYREGDPFARLWIEYYQCEKFSMKFQYTYADQNGEHEYEAHYTNTGVTFTNRGTDAKPVYIPAFDCSTRDQCADTIFKKVCQEKILGIAIRNTSLVGDQLTLNAAAVRGANEQDITHWIWELGGSTEAFYTGQQVEANVPGLSKTGTTVKLTAISKQGCFATAMQNIPPQKDPTKKTDPPQKQDPPQKTEPTKKTEPPAEM